MKRIFFVLLVALITACSPSVTPTPQPVFHIQASDGALPFMSDFYTCAEKYGALLVVDDIGSSDVHLQLGEPRNLDGSVYKIADEDIIVVTHPQAGVGSLTKEQIQAIYTRQYSNWKELNGNDVPILVWKYADGEDVQSVFDQTVMGGLRTLSSARLAASAQSMSDSVGLNPGSIGILPRHWKAGNTHETYLAANVPVLAILKSSPDDLLSEIIACVQK